MAAGVFLALDKLGGFQNLCLLLGALAINHIIVTGYRFLTTDCDGDPRTGFVGFLRIILFIPMLILQLLDFIYIWSLRICLIRWKKENGCSPGILKVTTKKK